MSYKLKVEGHTNLVRDAHSKAIVNTNVSEYQLYMARSSSKNKCLFLCSKMNHEH